MNKQQYYDAVAAELAEDNTHPGLWTRAISEADGNPEKTKAIYIKLRVEQLSSSEIQKDFEKTKEEIKGNFTRAAHKSINPARAFSLGVAVLAAGWAAFALLMGLVSGHLDLALIHLIISSVIGIPAYLIGKKSTRNQ
ncbi:hypothetical protein [Thiocapsa marina]|uniref:hypothetical protein n=1 Tax=Thiocapsa marina TaxID=244573 RepID=UPI001111DD6C|nr:hypothetical protein [Thiocapsa marina]